MDLRERKADFRFIALLAAILLALGLTPFALSLPQVDPAPGPGEFNTGRAIERLARVLGDQRPHSVDTDANDAVRDRILDELHSMGYAPQVRDDFSCVTKAKWGRTVCARVRNIVFRAGPQDGKAVMLAAHYDSVPAGPGAADDGLGVSVELEIAKLFADAPPEKPVLFLLTDGEEAGLLGAHSFVRTDPLADSIRAVINVEARGDKGPAMMFQTSQPNSADIAAFAKAAFRPSSNSMMTDIYRLLPNDTDVTEFLPKGYEALNFALVEGLSHYHTPRDDLAELDPRSVQHAGRQALGAVKAFFAEGAAGKERQLIFTDILSRWLIVAPQWLGGAILLFGLGAAGFSYARVKDGRAFRAIMTAPAVVVVGGVVCFVLQQLVAAARPAAYYWYAHPEAIEFLAYASAAGAAILALKFIAAGAGRERVVAASWFWFAAIGGAVWFVAPGASILFAPALLIYGAGVAAGFFASAAKRAFAILAALFALIVLGPALYIAGIALGGGAAPAFAVIAALIMTTAAPLALADEVRLGGTPAILGGAALLVALAAALFVPAYSRADPEPMSLNYFVDADAQHAQWLISAPDGEPAPKALAKIASFKREDIAGLADGYLAAPADYEGVAAPSLTAVSEEKTGDARKIRIRIASNGADVVYFRIPADAGAVAYETGGEVREFPKPAARRIYCSGRACDGAEFSFTLENAAPQDWQVFGLRFALPQSAAKLLAARSDTATPIQTGDATIVRTRIKF